MGVAIGSAAAVLAVLLGAVAALRPSGLGVAPVLAGDPLHLRALILIFCGEVAFVIGALWARLGRRAPSIARLRGQVLQTLYLCALTALLVLVVNYGILRWGLPDLLAIIPAAGALAIAIRYALIIHPLSGITGVALGARHVLRSSYIWLLVVAALQFAWTTARSFGLADTLWFAERAALDLALIGFCIPAALGVLQTNLNVVYHSRSMHQVLMRWHYIINGLLALWGLLGMWSMRFPGSYQGLLAAAVGVALMIFLALIALSSGLLDRRRLADGNRSSGDDGIWAIRLAAAAVTLIGVAGVLMAISAVTAAAAGGQPALALLGAELAAVGLGVVPLAILAAVAAVLGRLPARIASGAALIAGGAATAVVLWLLSPLMGGAMSAPAVGEMIAGAGAVLVLSGAARISVE